MQQFGPNIDDYIQGEVTEVRVVAPPNFPPPATGNHVIDPTKDFEVHVSWEVFGAVVPLWLNPLADEWDIRVDAESIGAGPEKRIGTATVPKADGVDCPVDPTKPYCKSWTATVTVEAGTLVEGNPVGINRDPSGIYRLTAVVFLNSSIRGAGYDLIGFGDGPAILVESPD